MQSIYFMFIVFFCFFIFLFWNECIWESKKLTCNCVGFSVDAELRQTLQGNKLDDSDIFIFNNKK